MEVADKVVADVVDVVRVAARVSSMAVAHAHKQRGSVRMKFRYTEKDKPRVPATGAGAVLGKADDKLCITVDTREQTPLTFDSDYISANRGTVPVFDYALSNDESGWACERKSLADFIQSVVLSKSWKRELAKIANAQERLLPVVYVCEFNFEDIGEYAYENFHSGRVTSQFVYRRVAELIYVHNVHIVFAGSRMSSAYAIALLLKRRKEALKS